MLILLGAFFSSCTKDSKKDTRQNVETVPKKEVIETPIKSTFVDWQIVPVDSTLDFYSRIEYLVINKKNRSLINSLGMFENLVGLDFSGQGVEVLPQAISKLTNLEIVIAHNNSIKEIPDWFCQLKNLREVYFENNKLKSFPDCITELQQLECLFFSNNRIQSLPEKIGLLFNLRKIEANSNLIKELPMEFYGLSNLEYCYLEGNNLINFELERSSDLKKLEILALTCSNLNEINIRYLPSLKKLYLTNTSAELKEKLDSLKIQYPDLLLRY